MKKDGKMPPTFLQKKHMRLSISLPDSDGVQYENIKYSIDSWSSFFGNFHPNNITKDISISDQFSKWSVDFKSKNEYIILKLDKTSIVQLITFGKYNDPTSLKEFKLYSGMTKDNMSGYMDLAEAKARKSGYKIHYLGALLGANFNKIGRFGQKTISKSQDKQSLIGQMDQKKIKAPYIDPFEAMAGKKHWNVRRQKAVRKRMSGEQ